MSEEVSWIAADWGTSNLRIWGVSATGETVVQRSSSDGMGGLASVSFEPALLSLIDDVLSTDRVTNVLVCGMAGAKQGWIEAPYASVPCVPSDISPVVAPTKDARLNVEILSGLSQQAPFDVMRGEETQISGFLSLNPNFDGVLCLPGTHTKWARVYNGIVHEFQTAMTGELFALLCSKSVLRHSMDVDGFGKWDDAAFVAGLEEGVANPNQTITQLFGIRAASLLSDQTSQYAKARLSGLLINTEITATKHMWENVPVRLVGASVLCSHYETALLNLNCKAEIASATSNEDFSLVGLKAAYNKLYGEV